MVHSCVYAMLAKFKEVNAVEHNIIGETTLLSQAHDLITFLSTILYGLMYQPGQRL